MSALTTSCARSAMSEDGAREEIPVRSEMIARWTSEIESRVQALTILEADHVAMCALRMGVNRLRERMPATRR